MPKRRTIAGRARKITKMRPLVKCRLRTWPADRQMVRISVRVYD